MNRISRKQERKTPLAANTIARATIGGETQAEKTAASSTNESRSLFHYTTAEGLIGIIQNQCLFATHADFLNDSTECRAILDVLQPRLEAQLKAIVPKLIARGVMHPSVETDYGKTIYRQEAGNILRAMVRASNSTAPFFITSFCLHKEGTSHHEHGLLSQWRGYARGGFAIEFDEFGIDKLSLEEIETFRYQFIFANVVEYNDHDARVHAADFSGFAGALIKNLFPDQVAAVADILGTKEISDFSLPFLSLAPFLKDASFQEETEYRIVALCNRPTVADKNDKRLVKPIKFRARPTGQVIPYISLYEQPVIGGLTSQPKVKLPVKSIIVGPHLHQEGQRAALEILLEQADLDVPIRFSGIPFRE
jgi:hypothetical protein